MIKIIPMGNFDTKFLSWLEELTREFYRRAGREPELLEIYIYSTTSRKRSLVFREAMSINVSVLGDFIVMHEAWRGWPRIHVDYEQCQKLEENVVRALILHELAHAKLHGSPYYYIIGLDKSLVEEHGFQAPLIAYLASIVVKDIEVIELLVELGYKKEVLSYSKFLKKDLGMIECNSLIEILEFSKLIAPYLITDNGGEDFNMKPSCRDKIREIKRTLLDLMRLKGGFDEKVKFLIWKLRELA